MRYAPLGLLTLIASLPYLAGAHSFAPDTPETGSVEDIAKATTEPRFLSPWVSYLPASPAAVSPRASAERIRNSGANIRTRLGARMAPTALIAHQNSNRPNPW